MTDLLIAELGIYGTDGQTHTRQVMAMGIFGPEAVEELIGWMAAHAPPLGLVPTREQARELLSGRRPVWILLESPDAVWAAFFIRPDVVAPGPRNRRGKR